MSNQNVGTENEKVNYSKFLSTLFSSLSIISLSILCILNNRALDLYSSLCILKVVVPASFCFWFIGFVIGKKLDNIETVLGIKSSAKAQKAYEIPSMFAGVEEAAVPTTEENNEVFTMETDMENVS